MATAAAVPRRVLCPVDARGRHLGTAPRTTSRGGPKGGSPAGSQGPAPAGSEGRGGLGAQHPRRGPCLRLRAQSLGETPAVRSAPTHRERTGCRGPADGRLCYRLKRRYDDGRDAVFYDPLDFVAKLLPLVPRPCFNELRYYGLLAGAARLRAQVLTPRPQKARPPRQLRLFGPKPKRPTRERPAVKTRCTFAELMRTTLKADVEICQRCGRGPLRYLGPVTDPGAIEALLAAIADQPKSPPPPAPNARGPPATRAAVPESANRLPSARPRTHPRRPVSDDGPIVRTAAQGATAPSEARNRGLQASPAPIHAATLHPQTHPDTSPWPPLADLTPGQQKNMVHRDYAPLSVSPSPPATSRL